jgi:hypothetical protein
LIESPDFDQVGRVNFYLKKIQNGVVLEKKQKSTGCNRVTRSTCRVTPGHDFFYFFINPARFQPRVASRPAGPGRFQNYDFTP